MVKWTGQINYWASKADNFTRRNNVITLLRYILNSIRYRKWLNVQFLYSEMYFVMDYIFLSLCIYIHDVMFILRNTTFLPKAAFPENHMDGFFFTLFVYLFAYTVLDCCPHEYSSYIINIKYIRLLLVDVCFWWCLDDCLISQYLCAICIFALW